MTGRIPSVSATYRRRWASSIGPIDRSSRSIPCGHQLSPERLLAGFRPVADRQDLWQGLQAARATRDREYKTFEPRGACPEGLSLPAPLPFPRAGYRHAVVEATRAADRLGR